MCHHAQLYCTFLLCFNPKNGTGIDRWPLARLIPIHDFLDPEMLQVRLISPGLGISHQNACITLDLGFDLTTFNKYFTKTRELVGRFVYLSHYDGKENIVSYTLFNHSLC